MPVIQQKLLKINFTKGRKRPIDMVVIHVVEGSMGGMRSWFNNPQAKVSSTYGVSLEGLIEQYVREEDTAWANGRVNNPKAELVLERMGVNPNEYSISIEHEGDGKQDMPPKQRAASAWLLNDIARRRPLITLDRRHVVRHNEIFALKTCPGKISVDKLVAAARELGGCD